MGTSPIQRQGKQTVLSDCEAEDRVLLKQGEAQGLGKPEEPVKRGPTF